MNAIKKFIFALLLTVGGTFFVSIDTHAAAMPYEYTFEKDVANTNFNGIDSINQMKITFDNPITISASALFNSGKNDNPIYVVQKGGSERINIIGSVAVSGNTLTVRFKNLNLIDYSDPQKSEYELKIDKETLQFDQLNGYDMPFNIYDILPGFKSTFIDTDATTINNNIFKTNAPRDVFIHVPKIFITGIETIHRYDGLTSDGLSPALTNIDVLADKEATRLKATFKGKAEYSRDLERRTGGKSDVAGFSMGQAGIDDITDNQSATINEFQLRAYDDYGKFLEQSNFKLRVADPKNDYIINDYLPKLTDEFGKTYTLYDLMSDKKLLEDIVSRIPVSQLDSLGVTYAVGNSSVGVSSFEELKMALANPKVTTITLNDNIDLTSEPSPFVIDHSVIIQGNHQLTGNVKLGIGQDINVRLNNVSINGDLTVDTGTDGSAILDNVYVNGATNIISGGVHSVHLNNFTSTNGITLNNPAQLRIVTTTPIPKIVLNGPGAVTLEGNYGTVEVSSSTMLKMTDNTQITTATIDSGQTLVVAGAGGTIGSTSGIGTLKLKPSAGGLSVDTALVPSIQNYNGTNVDITGAPLDSNYTIWAKVGSLALMEGTMPADPLGNGYTQVTSGNEELSAASGNFVNLIEVEKATNQIVGFNAIKVQPGDLGVYADPSGFSANVTLNGGSTVPSGYTMLSYSGIHNLFATAGRTSTVLAPVKGSTFNALSTNYSIPVFNGTQINVTGGRYISIIEVDGSNKVVGYYWYYVATSDIGTK